MDFFHVGQGLTTSSRTEALTVLGVGGFSGRRPSSSRSVTPRVVAVYWRHRGEANSRSAPGHQSKGAFHFWTPAALTDEASSPRRDDSENPLCRPKPRITIDTYVHALPCQDRMAADAMDKLFRTA